MVMNPVLAMRMLGTLPREFTQTFAPSLSKPQRRRDIGFTDSRPKLQPFGVSKRARLHGPRLYGHRKALHLRQLQLLRSGYNEYGCDTPSVLAVDRNTLTLQAHLRALAVPLLSSRHHHLANVVQVLVDLCVGSRTYASGGNNNNCQTPSGYSGYRRVNSNTLSGRAEFNKRPRTSGSGGRDFGGGGGSGGDDHHDRPGSDKVHSPGGRFRCPVYGKASNKTKNNCSLETFETEDEALQHALRRHEWCPICKREKIDTRVGLRSMDFGKLFFENMKNLRFHVLRHHLKVIRCPHMGCDRVFGLLNAFSRDGHARAHYPTVTDRDTLKASLEDDFAIAERALQSENPALFGLFDGVRKCKTREELEGFLYRDGVKVFDNQGDVDNISPPKTTPILDQGYSNQQFLSQILPGTPQTSVSEYPDTPATGFPGYQSMSSDVSHTGGRFSPSSNTNSPSFFFSDPQPLIFTPIELPGAPMSPDAFSSHGGDASMNRAFASGSGGYPVPSPLTTEGFSQMYDHTRRMSILWEKANLSERQTLFKTMSHFFLDIHEFVQKNVDVIEDTQPANYPSQPTVDSAFEDSIVHSYR